MNIVENISSKNRYGREISARPKVAGVLDEFSTACFSETFDFYPIGRTDYKMALEEIKPSLLLCESAWNGNKGQWLYQLMGTTGPKADFIDLTRTARELDIPVLFWNKEDPPHFEEFVETASLADHIFTTEAALIPEYRKRTGKDSVHLLRFAAEPALHRAEQVDRYREGDICFAGQYFKHKFPERRKQMEILFPAAQKYEFSIFSRVLGGQDEYQFPDEYAKYIVGSLPYSEMVNEYRRHKIFLNVNSVPQSKSMCARRIYELSASKTLVVGIPTEAVSSIYPSDEVLLVNSEQEASDVFEYFLSHDDAYLEATQKAWRRTLLNHTYEHRANEILSVAGMDTTAVHTPTNVYIKLTDISEHAPLETILESSGILSALKEASKNGLLGRVFLENREEISLFHNEELTQQNNNNSSLILMNARYLYGKNFLVDLILLAKQFPEADVIGKSIIQDSSNRIKATNKWVEIKDIVSDAAYFASEDDRTLIESGIGKNAKVFIGDDFNFQSNEQQQIIREV